jgi:cell division septation protein DedD
MTERDEKELVLGNKQLISLFFLAVALCGVFFALGYMIGHNSSKGSIASLDAPAAGSPSAANTEGAVPPNPSASSVDSAVAPPATTPDASVPREGQTYTQPARDTQTAPSAPAPVAPTVVAQKPAAASPVRVVTPESGATYIQVTALRQADAETLVKILREQSLPATLADSSKPDLFRVLLGPYRQTADVADAKAKLKALGFANAFVQKQ